MCKANHLDAKFIRSQIQTLHLYVLRYFQEISHSVFRDVVILKVQLLYIFVQLAKIKSPSEDAFLRFKCVRSYAQVI